MTAWREKLFGEIAETLPGKYISTSEYDPSGEFIIYGSNSIMGRSAKPLYDGPIIAFARIGSNCGATMFSAGPCWINNNAAGIRAKKDADTRFLYYWMQGFDFALIREGSGQPYISQKTLESQVVLLPPLSEQRAIAHILGTLDDKIELNRKMNQTLEALAQTEFKRMMEEGGGRKVALPKLIQINPPRSLRKGEVAPYLDMANMPTRSARALVVYDREYTSGMRFINGDTLVARITPCLENGKVCFVDFLGEGRVGWGSTEYIVLRPKAPLPAEYAYFLARTDEFRAFAISSMTGTSGRQRVPADCFEHFQVAVPPAKSAERFGHFAGAIFAKMKANDDESRTLAALRDALLPKLVSGEIRVRDAERFLKERGL